MWYIIFSLLWYIIFPFKVATGQPPLALMVCSVGGWEQRQQGGKGELDEKEGSEQRWIIVGGLMIYVGGGYVLQVVEDQEYGGGGAI